jgi:hypothetical protein
MIVTRKMLDDTKQLKEQAVTEALEAFLSYARDNDIEDTLRHMPPGLEDRALVTIAGIAHWAITTLLHAR